MDQFLPVEPAEFAVPLDTLADDGPDLVAAAYLLASDLFQAFRLPEVLQLTRDGQIRGRYWNKGWIPQILEWAAQAEATITDEVLPEPIGESPSKEVPPSLKSVNDNDARGLALDPEGLRGGVRDLVEDWLVEVADDRDGVSPAAMLGSFVCLGVDAAQRRFQAEARRSAAAV